MLYLFLFLLHVENTRILGRINPMLIRLTPFPDMNQMPCRMPLL